MTYTVASVPNYFYQGEIVSVQGNTTTGYNAAPLTILGTTSTTVTVTSSANPGSGAGGGTISLYCSNQTADGTTMTYFSTVYGVPANTLGVSQSALTLSNQFSMFSSSAPPYIQVGDVYGSTSIFSMQGSITPTASRSGSTGMHSLQIGMLSNNLAVVTPYPIVLGSVIFADLDGLYNPIPLTTTTTKNIKTSIKYNATAVATATYVSGGSFSGTGTCALTFNSSCTATGTLTVTSNTPGGIAVNTPGQSCSAAPIAATVGTCTGLTGSGTLVISSTLKGALGNALLLQSMLLK
jgi:hypothetical protein